MAKGELNVKAFALTGGILWAMGSFLLGLIAMTGYALEWVDLLATVYVGYGPSIGGAIIGAIWGFVDAGIGLLIFALLYNKLCK